MLTLVEEIVLLMIDDKGSFIPVRETAVDYSIAGATLMGLAFANRIDTDAEHLTVIDSSETGSALLDRALTLITSSEESKLPSAWIEVLATDEARSMREMALDSLIERGILERSGSKFMWVFERVRHPIVGDREERAVKRRIADVLLSDGIPEQQDAALICLADACGILPAIFSTQEIRKARPRIEQLRKLDLIGREMNGAIEEIERSIIIAMSHMPH